MVLVAPAPDAGRGLRGDGLMCLGVPGKVMDITRHEVCMQMGPLG